MEVYGAQLRTPSVPCTDVQREISFSLEMQSTVLYEL
jgi:hypothetical protein